MVNEYAKYSDEELIVQLRDGDHAITDYIMEKYKNLVRSKAQSMYILGADREDLIQEGMIGLFKAIRDYDTGRDASFFTFADLCVSRQMYTAIQAAGRLKNAPLNSYISIYADYSRQEEGESSEEVKLINSLISPLEKNPEELLIDRENVERIEQMIERELSPFEKQVLDLYLTGMSYGQIADILNQKGIQTPQEYRESGMVYRKDFSEQQDENSRRREEKPVSEKAVPENGEWLQGEAQSTSKWDASGVRRIILSHTRGDYHTA